MGGRGGPSDGGEARNRGTGDCVQEDDARGGRGESNWEGRQGGARPGGGCDLEMAMVLHFELENHEPHHNWPCALLDQRIGPT